MNLIQSALDRVESGDSEKNLCQKFEPFLASLHGFKVKNFACFWKKCENILHESGYHFSKIKKNCSLLQYNSIGWSCDHIICTNAFL